MAVTFSSRAQAMTPLTSDRGTAERAIRAIEPADTVTRIQEACAVEPCKTRTIVVLSDGRVEPIQTSSERIDLEYVPIGADTDRVGPGVSGYPPTVGASGVIRK